jgi:hypothetical protein
MYREKSLLNFSKKAVANKNHFSYIGTELNALSHGVVLIYYLLFTIDY